jgi:hypothetical protein
VTRAPVALMTALALGLASMSAGAQTRVIPHPLPRPVLPESVPPATPEAAAPAATGLRASLGTERAARLLRSSDADDVVRGIERLTPIETPEALALLVRAAASSPLAASDGVTGSARRDPRALLAVVRALAPWVDREPARKALRDVLEAPLQQLDPAAGAPSEAGDAGSQARGPLRVLLARQQAAMALAASTLTPALEVLIEAARKGTPGEAPALAALAANPPESPQLLGGVTLTTRSTIALAAAIGDLRTLDAILGAVKASDGGLRAAAIAALGETGDARVLDAARAAVHDADAKVRVAGAGALVHLGAQDAAGAVEALIADEATALDGLYLASDVQGEGVIRAAAARAAASAAPSVRAAALAAVGRQVSGSAVSALVQLGRDPRLQGDAAGALARSPSLAALPALEVLGASAAQTRLAARAYMVRRLVRGERSDALDGLLTRLAASSDGRDRAVGVAALVALGARPLGPALADPDARVRRAAAMAAGARPGATASAALLSRLAVEGDPTTRSVLALGLVEGDDRGWLPTSLLLERARSGGPDAPLATLAYARRADGSADAELAALLSSGDPVIRAHAARGLGASRAPDAAGRLARAYEFEADPTVRRALVAALAARGGDAACPALRASLDLAARLDPDIVARSAARRALAGTPAPAARPRMVLQVAWVSLAPAEGATLPVGTAGMLVDAEGLAAPLAFDDDGFALLPGVAPGEAQLRLAPSLPPYLALVP